MCTALTTLGIEPPEIDVWAYAWKDGRLAETEPTSDRMKAPNPAVDAYIDGLPADKQEPMRQLRATIRAAAPDADEVITYKMPGLKARGSFLV